MLGTCKSACQRLQPVLSCEEPPSCRSQVLHCATYSQSVGCCGTFLPQCVSTNYSIRHGLKRKSKLTDIPYGIHRSAAFLPRDSSSAVASLPVRYIQNCMNTAASRNSVPRLPISQLRFTKMYRPYIDAASPDRQ